MKDDRAKHQYNQNHCDSHMLLFLIKIGGRRERLVNGRTGDGGRCRHGGMTRFL